MMSCGMSCMKYLLFSFNLLFMTSGIAIALIAELILRDYSYYELFFGGNVFAGCMLLVIVGAIVFIVPLFGCCGALKENRCMVTTFSVLLFILFAIEIGGSIAGYVLKDAIIDDPDKQLNSTLSEYEFSKDIRKSWDILQTDFQCCGINGPDDWITAQLKIPASCCNGYADNEKCTGLPYQKGCFDSLEKFIGQHVVVLGSIGIGIASVQLVGIILACSWAVSIRKGYAIM